ncbi:ABC transporter ATP-binding protein, partial [bacterium]|nr:ABC transporter ATP-binding protein [bacterium]
AIPLGLLDGVTAFAIKPYMDYVIGQKDWVFNFLGYEHTLSWQTFLYILPFGVVLFAIVQGVLRYLNTYISEWTSQKITNSVKIDLFKNLVQMDSKFFDENSSGIILSRYLNDPSTAADGLIDKIKTITTSIFGALGLICVMLYSSWQLTSVGVIILCVAFIPVLLIRNLIKETSNQKMVINGNIRTNMNETYSGNKIMNSYSLQERQSGKFEHEINESFKVSMHLIKRSGWMSPLMYLIASIGIAIVLWFGTKLITSGHISSGSFASFITSLLLLYKPVKTLGSTLTSIQNIFVAMGRVFELFDIIPDIQEKPNAIEFSGLENSIKLNDVVFEYVTDKPVLKNINLRINKNETVAIVGNSGGGKSTIVNLITRFYDVTSGSVQIDNVDIRDYSIESLRKNIAVVFQDNFLYSGTIRENIMMGNFDATEEDLYNAVKSAYLEDMIADMREGIDTVIGERGTTLSGGQRQRVAIARAMIKNSSIIILDEATSALDNQSEAVVQKAINNLMKEKTVIVIAHRLSTVKNADRIIVLNEGEIVEEGSHDELINIPNGYYKKLYEMQFKKQEAFV